MVGKNIVWTRKWFRKSINKWIKTLYRDYLHRFANFCAAVLKIKKSSQNKPFLTTLNVENKYVEVHMKRLKILVKWHWWWNPDFTCACTMSLNFESYVLEFPWEIGFGVLSGNYLCQKLQENLKKNCKIPKIILIQGFFFPKTWTCPIFYRISS